MRDMIDRIGEWDLGDLFDGLFEPARFERIPRPMQMKTDVKEDENAYELDIELPGFEKNEIDISLKNGYLNVSAKKTEKMVSGEKPLNEHKHEKAGCGCGDEKCECKDEHSECKDEHCECEHKKPYIRKERSFYASRSYYVGDKIKEEDIKAKYQNGVLSLIVPKEKPKELTSHKINID